MEMINFIQITKFTFHYRISQNVNSEYIVFCHMSESESISNLVLTMQEKGVDSVSLPQVTFRIYHVYILFLL